MALAVGSRLQGALRACVQWQNGTCARRCGALRALTCSLPPLRSKRYFSVKEAYEEGLVDKLIPGE